MRTPWTCPLCGRTLNVRNQEHVCGRYDLDSHFINKDLVGRIAFDWMCDMFDSLGEYEMLPMKTTIAFIEGVNVAFLTTKRKGAEISIVMPKPPDSPRVGALVPYSKSKTIVRFRIADARELDQELAAWLREAYEGRR